MKIQTEYITLSTKGDNDIIDITYRVEEALKKTQLEEGSALLFVPGSTAGLTTMEYEPGQIQDLKEILEALVPRSKTYAHNHSLSGSDGNAHSHLRASVIGPDLAIPFKDGELLLGTWQQIVFIDFDIYPRQRKVVMQFSGE